MSVKMLQPPQTYSRLFRPWDSAKDGPQQKKISLKSTESLLSPPAVGPAIFPPFADTMAYLGVDPYTLSLMEQEYARVLAEEAAAKQMSAKKQRPKKFKCPHCDVAFSNNGQLKGHIRIHTGKFGKLISLESRDLLLIITSSLSRNHSLAEDKTV